MSKHEALYVCSNVVGCTVGAPYESDAVSDTFSRHCLHATFTGWPERAAAACTAITLAVRSTANSSRPPTLSSCLYAARHSPKRSRRYS